MVSHRSAMGAELTSEFFQRAAVLVGGSHVCKLRRRQSTLGWPRWASPTITCGGGVDAIDVPKRCLEAGV